MALSIYKTILVENLMQDDTQQTMLKGILEKHTLKRTRSEIERNAQSIFDEISELEGWATPAEERSETAVTWWDEIYPISLNDGTPAGLCVQKANGNYNLTVIKI